MPMMICVALGSGGVLLCVVSVLCGAGGASTVQPPVTNAVTQTASARRRTDGHGTGQEYRAAARPPPKQEPVRT